MNSQPGAVLPLVSIIVATKNEASNISRCLGSALTQLYPKDRIEIIVVDNFSRDGTAKLATRFTDKVFSVGPNRAAQLNFGVGKSSGEYLLFPDADMMLSSTIVAECVTMCESEDYDALYIPETIVGSGPLIAIRNFERSFYTGTVIDAVRFVRSTTFSEAGMFDERLIFGADDWDFDRRITGIARIGISKAQVYHHEGDLGLSHYLGKKRGYVPAVLSYVEKWGVDDPVVKKQTGFSYRLFIVFLEEGKWKRLVRNPPKAILMSTIRLLVGVQFMIGAGLSSQPKSRNRGLDSSNSNKRGSRNAS